MMLYIRMVLYAIFAGIAGQELGLDFNQTTGMISFHVDDAAKIVTGVLGYVLTFVASRYASARGGKT